MEIRHRAMAQARNSMPHFFRDHHNTHIKNLIGIGSLGNPLFDMDALPTEFIDQSRDLPLILVGTNMARVVEFPRIPALDHFHSRDGLMTCSLEAIGYHTRCA